MREDKAKNRQARLNDYERVRERMKPRSAFHEVCAKTKHRACEQWRIAAN
jgi:hypothetical protein